MKTWICIFFLAPLFAQHSSVTVILGGRGWSCMRNGKRHLVVRGDRLRANEELQGGNETGDLLLDCGTKGWFTQSCASESCAKHACNEDESVQVSKLLHLASAFFLRSEPEEPATLGVRGGGNPSDAVVLQDSMGMHWGPALTRVLEGRYCFRLIPLPVKTSGPPHQFTLDWNRSIDGEGLAPVPNLPPGLYSLEKGTPGASGACAVDSDGAASWIVVAAEPAFEKLNRQWEAEQAELDRMHRSGASLPVIAAVRHAALAALIAPESK
jgi:hypothetical protein